MAPSKGWGRRTSIEKLPSECDEIIAWTADALRDRDRDQQDIYAEFVTRLEQLKADSHGELEFAIPARSSFFRYSMKLATLTRRLETTRAIAKSISERFDAQASDELTLIGAEAIKTLVFELLTDAGESGIDPKGAMNLANALRLAVQAQSVSTARRQKAMAEFEKKTDEALAVVAKEKGLSSDTVAQLRREFLGVREPKDEGDA